MKTLFITIYDGAISKNILRTDIFRILKEKFRLVLFVPRSKVGYYEEHFANENVLVEATPQPSSPYFEAKFQSLALDFFHTESVRIKIAHRYAVDGKLFRMLFKRSLWEIGRFHTLHRILRTLYGLVPDRTFDPYFEKFKPDAVFVPNMMSNDDYRMIKTARRFGVKSIGMPKSWDNLTTKTFFNAFPDHIMMQNDLMRQTAMRLFGYPEKHMTVVGHPPFDVYALPGGRATREEFCAALGLDPDKKIILYAGAGKALAPHDEEVLAHLIDAVETNPKLRDAQILVRPHPKYDFDDAKVPRKSFVILDKPGITVTHKKSSWEFLDDDIVHLADSLTHMDVLISTASTLNLEGAIFDKPLVSIGFDGSEIQPLVLSVSRYYSYEHLRPLVDSGGMPVALDESLLVDYVAMYLKDPAKDALGRKRIVDDIVWRADGKSGKRVAEAIINFTDA